jgi:hypothetical protein
MLNELFEGFLQKDINIYSHGYKICRVVYNSIRINVDFVRVVVFSQSRIAIRGVAQPGRALALGARSRRFESGRPDHPD